MNWYNIDVLLKLMQDSTTLILSTGRYVCLAQVKRLLKTEINPLRASENNGVAANVFIANRFVVDSRGQKLPMSASSTDSCKLLACQVSIPPVRTVDDRQRHLAELVEKLSHALSTQAADLLVLPELTTVDYSRENFEQLPVLAEDLDGPSFVAMRKLAMKFKVTIVFGMPRRWADDYFISQLVVGADGDLLGCYDKLHICQYGASMEKEFFKPGKNLAVFDVAGFKFSPIICYDIRFPELCRTLVLQHQVDCILHCGAYFRDESFASWHSFATTRAIENQIYLLSLNRAGQGYGDSVFCLPWMDEASKAIHFEAHAQDFRYVTISRKQIQQARACYTFLCDRQADYQALALDRR